ncbi:toll/interleukin-1 receptor domain-containing protein [Saccharothrix sp. S26]|uniref:toll/interleukin-1 receptor domain-containing protein n=1 Tax=Saccharothrix sp. S26 TaxID=2907215 RepID=UPI001F2757BE|nr:toll/interleukin-1 receptor domain-containing protein [Saccharothrix sp. S26]MCE6999023.1 toll/interleukin-1 receptor domain-containing protein [Saccharothrix sp. S26]
MQWDFFLAHAGADSPTAERLRSLLAPRATVFEDSMLRAGEEWDVVLDRHLRASMITVVLVSRRTEHAVYLREEIARAISLARADGRRRVVPLVLEHVDALPYGLELRTPLRLGNGLDLAGAADALVETLHDARRPRSEGPHVVAAQLGPLLRQLDLDALGGVESDLLAAAVAEVGGSDALWLHLARRGLDARVLLPSLPGHDEAAARWALGADAVPGARDLPAAVRRQLVRRLADERVDLDETSVRLRRAVLSGRADAPDARRLASALDAALPPPRSTATEAVLVPRGGSVGLPVAPSPLHRTALGMTALPPREPALVGRAGLVADLAERVTARLARHGRATVLLTGQLGAGVSAVAVEAAHVLADWFPGGVRYVDLLGLDAKREAADVAKLVCHSVGVTPEPGAEAAHLRTALDGRGLLLVLDNALDAKHVAPLVPAPPGCAVVVTSRNRTQSYADVVAHVPPLERAASVELLADVRPGAPAEALDRIAAACADLPMALRLIAAWMTNHPETGVEGVARLVSRERTRLAFLDDDVLPMRLAIELSYRHLDDDGRTAFRFLPAAPGSAATAEALGHGLDRDPDLTRLTLYRLVDRGVAGHEEAADPPEPVFRLFELVRLYARERLAEEDPPEVVARFRRRLLTRLRDDLRAGAEPDLALRLDPSPLVAARDLAEREEWFDLAGDLTDGLRTVHEAESDAEAVRRDREHAARLRHRGGDAETAARGYLELARTLDGRAAENAFASAERVAADAGLWELVGRITHELAVHREAGADLAGALEAGDRSVTALRSALKNATALPVAINNARLAIRLDDLATARRWAAVAHELIDARTPKRLRADAAYEQARATTGPGVPALWREASELYEQDGKFGSAGLAAFFGGRAARGLGAGAEAAELFQAAAHLHRRAGDHDRSVWATVELAAACAEIGHHARARDLLTALDDQPTGTWRPGVLAEVELRIAVLAYLADGLRTAPERLPAVPDDDDRARRLSPVVAALRAPERHTMALRRFAESRMVFEPPPYRPWLHGLGEEPPDRRELPTG